MPRGLESPPAMPESLKSGVARQGGDIAPAHPRGLFVGCRLVLRAQLAVMPRGLESPPAMPESRKSGVARQGGDIAPAHPRGLFVGSRLVLRSRGKNVCRSPLPHIIHIMTGFA